MDINQFKKEYREMLPNGDGFERIGAVLPDSIETLFDAQVEPTKISRHLIYAALQLMTSQDDFDKTLEIALIAQKQGKRLAEIFDKHLAIENEENNTRRPDND
jgi:hypothetical protein